MFPDLGVFGLSVQFSGVWFVGTVFGFWFVGTVLRAHFNLRANRVLAYIVL